MAKPIQSKKLPSDWQERVQDYNISFLSPQTQAMVNLIKKQITKANQDVLGEKELLHLFKILYSLTLIY